MNLGEYILKANRVEHQPLIDLFKQHRNNLIPVYKYFKKSGQNKPIYRVVEISRQDNNYKIIYDMNQKVSKREYEEWKIARKNIINPQVNQKIYKTNSIISLIDNNECEDIEDGEQLLTQFNNSLIKLTIYLEEKEKHFSILKQKKLEFQRKLIKCASDKLKAEIDIFNIICQENESGRQRRQSEVFNTSSMSNKNPMFNFNN